MLGDSFTEALQVKEEESYRYKLQKILNKQSKNNKGFEVLNAGVKGYSPIVHYLNYKNKLSNLDSDLVIAQLFVNDIFEDNHYTQKSIMGNDGLPVKINYYFYEKFFNKNIITKNYSNPPSWHSIHNFSQKYSRFYEYLNFKIFKTGKNLKLNKKMRSINEFNDGYQFFILQGHDYISSFHDVNFETRTWNLTKKYLLALRDIVKTDGAEFMILLIPIEAQLELREYGNTSKTFFPNGANKRLNNLLEIFSKKNNIKFLDLLPSFEKHTDQKLFFKWDGHLTAEGHAVATNSILDALSPNSWENILK